MPESGHQPSGPRWFSRSVHLSFGDNHVLQGVSFRLPFGETKALFGVAGGQEHDPEARLGLFPPDSGRITVLGNRVTELPEEQLFPMRSQLGMVFQESALFDSLTVRENVAYRLMEEHGIYDDEIDLRVRESLRFVELEHTLDLFPFRTFRWNAASRRYRSSNNHTARTAALRLADRRTGSRHFQYDR